MTTNETKHWTEVFTFENIVTREQLTAAELRSRYERFLRLHRCNLINVLRNDHVRMDDDTRWVRIR
jgi:hypothetical protein